MDDLVKRAREFCPNWGFLSADRGIASGLIEEMADRIETLEEQLRFVEGERNFLVLRIEALERGKKLTAARDFVEVAGDVDRLIDTARREALEEAAAYVEEIAGGLAHPSVYMGWRVSEGAKYIADAIRALKEGE
jgi:hypothetical protein